MLAPVAITTTLLAVFSDEPSLDELVERAILTKDQNLAQTVIDALVEPAPRKKFLDGLEKWMRQSKNLDELEIRANTLAMFCDRVNTGEFWDRVVRRKISTFGGHRVIGVAPEALETGDKGLQEELKKAFNPRIDFVNLPDNSADDIFSWDPTRILLYDDMRRRSHSPTALSGIETETAVFFIPRNPSRISEWKEEWVAALQDVIEQSEGE